jgi:hypothetical protein
MSRSCVAHSVAVPLRKEDVEELLRHCEDQLEPATGAVSLGLVADSARVLDGGAATERSASCRRGGPARALIRSRIGIGGIR